MFQTVRTRDFDLISCSAAGSRFEFEFKMHSEVGTVCLRCCDKEE